MVRAPDLVLLDVRMQGMDGVQTLRPLREIAPATSVIMVTANEDVGLAGVAQAGASQDAAAPMSGNAWRDLALAVLPAVRGMSAVPRVSTGERLESAAMRGAREAAAGLTVVQSAVELARQALRTR